ncbi:diacylglycerol kinase family protein [Streptomyces sp. NBC_01410]|uniref:diacylglycerol kinase family protein n=1 Tax=Streptomyces sp. NBC_01410 TaxID=2903856 RepID=UPI003863E1CB
MPLVTTAPGRARRDRQANVPVPALPAGQGLIAVVNSGAGSDVPAEIELRTLLPETDIRLCDGGDLQLVLGQAAKDVGARGGALGIAGGDGTVNAAAVLAAEGGLPLAVFPAGTLNHFATDLRITDPQVHRRLRGGGLRRNRRPRPHHRRWRCGRPAPARTGYATSNHGRNPARPQPSVSEGRESSSRQWRPAPRSPGGPPPRQLHATAVSHAGAGSRSPDARGSPGLPGAFPCRTPARP